MKKLFVIGVIFSVSLLCLAALLLLDVSEAGNAQVADPSYQKLLERDKNVPREKVDKAFGEAKKNRDDIVAMIEKIDSGFVLDNESAPHLIYDNPGSRGTTINDLSWMKNKTGLGISFRLGFNKDEALKSFRRAMEGISMGEFFDAPGIGDEARVVKNVQFNKRNTSVGLHFVKGRAKVSVYLTNHKRSTAKNEKELMKIVRLIEPLIKAKPSFDDL